MAKRAKGKGNLRQFSAEDNRSYLTNIATSTLKGIVSESDNKQNRMLFKLAVEMVIMMNVIVSS